MWWQNVRVYVRGNCFIRILIRWHKLCEIIVPHSENAVCDPKPGINDLPVSIYMQVIRRVMYDGTRTVLVSCTASSKDLLLGKLVNFPFPQTWLRFDIP